MGLDRFDLNPSGSSAASCVKWVRFGDEEARQQRKSEPFPVQGNRERLVGVTGTPTPVWDRATRLVHWAFAPLILFLWWTAHNDRMDWHRWAGFAVLGLLVFRLAWGVLGGSTARFSHFVKGPAAAFAYGRGLFAKARKSGGRGPQSARRLERAGPDRDPLLRRGLRPVFRGHGRDRIRSARPLRRLRRRTDGGAPAPPRVQHPALADRPAPLGHRLLRPGAAREPGRPDGHGPAPAAGREASG